VGGSLRAAQAALTRDVILRAARELFATEGYAGVGVKQLAERAGVSVQTIYDAFGSKAGIVRSFVDVVDRAAEIGELAGQMERTEDPRRMLALAAKMRRQTRERCGDIERVLRQAAAEPAVAETWAEGMRRRHSGQLGLARRLEALGALRPGLGAQRAADLLAAYSAGELCDVLVDQRGWSLDAYERWLAETLAAQLLAAP
jgi:AcrR family transcriptional regulator